jgi:thiol-disulfide isomerase/thioredoxin
MIKTVCAAGYAVAAALLTMPGCWKNDSPSLPSDALKQPLVGKPAPEIAGTTLDGKSLRLSDQRGKVVLLSFWHFACPPCRAQIPHEQAIAKRFEGRPFALLGVHSHPSDAAKALSVTTSLGASWPSWHDQDGSLFAAYHGEFFPTMVVVDHKGVVRLFDVGAQSGHALDAFLETLIKEAEKDRTK